MTVRGMQSTVYNLTLASARSGACRRVRGQLPDDMLAVCQEAAHVRVRGVLAIARAQQLQQLAMVCDLVRVQDVLGQLELFVALAGLQEIGQHARQSWRAAGVEDGQMK